MTQKLSETVPAALRAELARRGVLKGTFARCLGHGEMWLYRRLNGRAEITLSELDQILAELDMAMTELLATAPVENTPSKTSAGRGTGRRSHTTPTPH